VLAQLDEAEGAGPSVIDESRGAGCERGSDRAQQQGHLAATEAALEFVVENKRLNVSHHGVAQCRIHYYLMDIELLFSRQPFVQQQSAQFSFVRPNRSDLVSLAADKHSTAFELPPEFESSNVIIEVVAGGIRRAQAHYAHVLLIRAIEPYGELRIAHQGTRKPLARVYVKVYARLHSGEVRFYKDGYTDVRGGFDYASLSTDELGQVERFAILILSEEHGAVIREVGPPKR
jgi:hypothetical protein